MTCAHNRTKALYERKGATAAFYATPNARQCRDCGKVLA